MVFLVWKMYTLNPKLTQLWRSPPFYKSMRGPCSNSFLNFRLSSTWLLIKWFLINKNVYFHNNFLMEVNVPYNKEISLKVEALVWFLHSSNGLPASRSRVSVSAWFCKRLIGLELSECGNYCEYTDGCM